MKPYIVIARKWRPQTFDEIKGQEYIITTLKNSISSGRIAHAYLFTGVRGVGKTTVARILAKAFNCVKGPTTMPCLQCVSCKEIPEGKSIDVLEIDGASNRGIDRIRELREGISYRPARDRYKIYIIDEVHMLTTEAFNALLKTLEEPPLHVIFLFATTEPHKIPETILSRCQRFDFRRIPLPIIIEHLQNVAKAEGINFEPDALRIIARESEGSMRDGMSLMEQVISFAGAEVKSEDVQNILSLPDRKWLVVMLSALKNSNSAPCIEIVNEASSKGVSIRQLMSNFANFLSECLRLKFSVANPQELTFTENERMEIENILKDTNPEFLPRLLGICLDAVKEISISRLPKLTAELAMLRMANAGKIIPAGEILKKLEDISKKFTPSKSQQIEIPKEVKKDIVVELPSSPVITEKEWKDFIENLSKTPFYSSLKKVKFIREREDKVELSVKENYENFVELRNVLEQYMSKHFKRKILLLIKKEEIEEKTQKDDKSMKINRLLKHPVMNIAKEIFKAEIKNVNIYD